MSGKPEFVVSSIDEKNNYYLNYEFYRWEDKP